ncbi:hypothetical protein [Novosphingobium resinovorum]|uniref:Uncharacterized protein n=1 Tax=Novosphingobium resinovorum TaxID=158500 RepID=A0A1D8AFK7_9SPHN|nr:hypothetical protein [Novosphingobium resinovorum]AOR80898.1 hypothetical protein BES08_29345 [Novosphingobium resinovorum]
MIRFVVPAFNKVLSLKRRGQAMRSRGRKPGDQGRLIKRPAFQSRKVQIEKNLPSRTRELIAIEDFGHERLFCQQQAAQLTMFKAQGISRRSIGWRFLVIVSQGMSPTPTI